jgi:hypothetical protein
MRDESGNHQLDALLRSAGGGDHEAMALAFDRYRGQLERMVRVRIDPRVRLAKNEGGPRRPAAVGFLMPAPALFL